MLGSGQGLTEKGKAQGTLPKERERKMTSFKEFIAR